MSDSTLRGLPLGGVWVAALMLGCPEASDTVPRDRAPPPLCEAGQSGDAACAPGEVEAPPPVEADACDDPPCAEVPPECECVNGACEEHQPCGYNDNGHRIRVCHEGRWGRWQCFDGDECEDGDVEHRPCGLNGRGQRTRSCEMGRWLPYAPCDDPDVCCIAPGGGEGGEARGSGPMSVACCDDPDDPDDDPDDCEDGARFERSMRCPLSERMLTVQCDEGQWPAFESCIPGDACPDPGSRIEVACGLNGRGRIPLVCRDHVWVAMAACDDPDACIDGTELRRVCGSNSRGQEGERCVLGRWQPPSGCVDPDECVDGHAELEACFAQGTQRFRRCLSGRWSRWTACFVARPCSDDGDCGPDHTCGRATDGRAEGACLEPSCEDGVRNPDEEGVDCGGACPACEEERCNGRDDDGDGEIDEDFRGVLFVVDEAGGRIAVPCTVGQGACRAEGTMACGDNGEPACDVRPGGDHRETCNGIDDDCDGAVDEAADRACVAALAGVAAAVCQDGACVIDACAEGRADHDNDPSTGCEVTLCDEAAHAAAMGEEGTLCEIAIRHPEPGRCRCRGVWVCHPDGDRIACALPDGRSGWSFPPALEPHLCPPELRLGASAEACNGRDDDCDGRVDELYPDALAAERCHTGVGACRAEGTVVCGPDGGTRCAAQTGAPGLEVCGGGDEDCDGLADPDDPDASAWCIRQGAAVELGIEHARCVTEGEAVGCVIERCAPGCQDENGDAADGCEVCTCDPRRLSEAERARVGTPCGLPMYRDDPTCQCVGTRICVADGAGGATTACGVVVGVGADRRVVSSIESEMRAACAVSAGGVEPVDVEPGCDGRDDDCDGIVDEGCGP